MEASPHRTSLVPTVLRGNADLAALRPLTARAVTGPQPDDAERRGRHSHAGAWERGSSGCGATNPMSKNICGPAWPRVTTHHRNGSMEVIRIRRAELVAE